MNTPRNALRGAVVAAIAAGGCFAGGALAAGAHAESVQHWWSQYRFTVAVMLEDLQTLEQKVESSTWPTIAFSAGQVCDAERVFADRRPPLPGFSRWATLLNAVNTYQIDAHEAAKAGSAAAVPSLAASDNSLAGSISALTSYEHAHKIALPTQRG